MVYSKSTVKIIFETRRELQLELQDASIYFRRRIYGLDRKYKDHGISYLEYQLRRNGISPQALDDHLKGEIVDKLGGHPVAIALCADAIYDEGIIRVTEILKQKKGFYLNFVKSILRNIDLSDDERLILNLLSGCRLPVPREAILATFDYPVAPYLRNLIQLCMVEVDPASNIRLPGLLESFFDIEVIPVEIRKRFHRNCFDCYKGLFIKNKAGIEYAIEADLHGGLGDIQSNLSGQLVDSQLAIARKLYDKQDYKTAQTVLDRILKVKSTNDILRFSALVDARCNNFVSALDKAKIVFRKNLHDTWLLSDIARTALSQGRDDIAEELIGIAKVANMEDTSILLVSGRMLLRRGELRNAEERFKDACKLTKRNAWPYYFLGKTYLRQGDIENAIDVLFEGEKFFYENDIRKINVLTAIRTQLGIAYILDERIDLASPILERLFEDESDDPEVMRAYAMMSLKKEGIQKAHEAYKRLKEAEIKSNYDRSQYHLFYGLFYLGIGEKGEASEEFSKAHKADRNNVYVMMKLAKTYFEMATESWIDGDVDIAKTYATDCGEIVKKILEFDYDNVTGRNLQEDLYNKFGIELSKALD
jgi:tetratricopeptide (TPR) repeat protein